MLRAIAYLVSSLRAPDTRPSGVDLTNQPEKVKEETHISSVDAKKGGIHTPQVNTPPVEI